MARLGRLVIPDLPHHVTQRGNGRPIGGPEWLAAPESLTGRTWRRADAGRSELRG